MLARVDDPLYAIELARRAGCYLKKPSRRGEPVIIAKHGKVLHTARTVREAVAFLQARCQGQ